MARTAIYLRISQDALGLGLAIARQRQDCERIAAERGWEVVETYVDDSISASKRAVARPAYDQMVEDFARGRFDALVCWDLDRLTRQPRQLEDWIDAAEDRGLKLVTANGEADLSTDGGRLFARMKAAVARSEVERKSARQKRAHQQRAEAGKPWAHRRPFGFEEDAVTHRPLEAAALRDAYSDLIAGVPQSAIARGLNARGMTTSLGNPWRQSQLRTVLQNPRYAGLSARNGEIVGKGTWEPIVSEDVWRVAQSRMDGTTAASTKPGPVKYLLTGVASCGVCGAKVRVSYTSRQVRMYACSEGQCVGRKMEPVDQLVEAVVVTRLRGPELRELLPVDDDREPLEADLSVLEERLEALAVQWADGEFTDSQFRAASSRLKSRIDDGRAKLAARVRGDAVGTLLSARDPGDAYLALPVARRREVIRLLLEVTIDRTRRGGRFDPESVRIEWRSGE